MLFPFFKRQQLLAKANVFQRRSNFVADDFMSPFAQFVNAEDPDFQKANYLGIVPAASSFIIQDLCADKAFSLLSNAWK